ncbi:neuroendocrine convertase 2 [Grus japonensis]|uniref:Neuroendocrine convertase 2 n=1 Tax=Grus japonensis TaxID=30415 RepID=A0ABC9WQI7_GRUJA
MPAGPPLLRGALLLLLLLFLGAPARGVVYTNHFLVELHGGGQAEAERVAAEHGFGGVRKKANGKSDLSVYIKPVGKCVPDTHD